MLPMLRGSGAGHAVFPGIPAEFTNWCDEQRAWHESVVLFEQSYHMTEPHLRVVGLPTASSWLQFNAGRSVLRVEATRDENMIVPRPGREKVETAGAAITLAGQPPSNIQWKDYAIKRPLFHAIVGGVALAMATSPGQAAENRTAMTSTPGTAVHLTIAHLFEVAAARASPTSRSRRARLAPMRSGPLPKAAPTSAYAPSCCRS
jgi:hypothetical protein